MSNFSNIIINEDKVTINNLFLYSSDDNYLTVIYLNKHINAKKLSSHLWFFEGFCRLLHPKYCVFIDVGTVPENNGIVKFYISLESDKSIGGVSGFMGLYFNVEENEQRVK